MTPEELELVQFKVANEGLDYCFIEYSTFPEIEDPVFRSLVGVYVNAYKALWTYLKMEDYDY